MKTKRTNTEWKKLFEQVNKDCERPVPLTPANADYYAEQICNLAEGAEEELSDKEANEIAAAVCGVKMTVEQAIAEARAYTAKRKTIRKLLIAAARAANPRVTDNETRKLHCFTSDLSDKRLLALIDG